MEATEPLFQRIPERYLLKYLPQLVQLQPKFAGDALYNRLSSENIDATIA